MSSLNATTIGSSLVVGPVEWVISFAIRLLVMVWIYNIAKRKGRHAFGWLILGLFFWLIALIVVA